MLIVLGIFNQFLIGLMNLLQFIIFILNNYEFHLEFYWITIKIIQFMLLIPDNTKGTCNSYIKFLSVFYTVRAVYGNQTIL